MRVRVLHCRNGLHRTSVPIPHMSTEISTAPSPLTCLTEEEQAFREAVAEFARGEIAPRVRAMEAAGKLDPALFAKYFEMGLMGIQVPGQYGWRGFDRFHRP